MNLKYKQALIIFVLIFAANLSFGQSGEIKIRFIGNAGIYMTDGNLNIYVDFPYKSGAYGYMEYDKAELDSIKENALFISTHKHADHYSGKHLRKALRTKNGKKFTPWKTSKLEEYSKTIPNFDIQILRTKHRFSLRHNSYLITWHGKRIYFSGDTESSVIWSNVKNLDLSIVTPWILQDAKQKGLKIDTEKYAIYHLYPDERFDNKNPEKIELFDTQGEAITLKYQ